MDSQHPRAASLLKTPEHQNNHITFVYAQGQKEKVQEKKATYNQDVSFIDILFYYTIVLLVYCPLYQGKTLSSFLTFN